VITLVRFRGLRRALALAIAAGVLTLAALGAAWVARAAWVGAGFYAKQLCSSVFVAGRAPHDVVERDLARMWPSAVFRRVGWHVDAHEGRVEASWFGLVTREARHRPGYGCTLIAGETGRLLPVGRANARVESLPAPAAMPKSARLPREAPRPALERVLDEAFAESGPEAATSTRAVVVLRDGRVVAERYAPGFSADMRFPGWSLTKSVFNAVAGAMIERGMLSLEEPVRVAAWHAPGDPRAAISYDHLLRMSSGLAFTERYEDPFSDVTTMLFATRGAGAYAAARPMEAPPGTVWRYASGTSNVLADALRAHLPSDLRYLDLPRRLLFEPLGMSSAVVELDEAATFIASSYMLATARDWARFGALFAADGMWDGRRLLPEGWVAYSRTPAPADASAQYGAHFWLHHEEERTQAARATSYPLPPDAFFAGGFAGQRITIVPSRGIVVVRLGYDLDAFNNAGFAARVLEVLDAGAGAGG
jgi:CubicO group peptidase (beta-lactamase class C family)